MFFVSFFLCDLRFQILICEPFGESFFYCVDFTENLRQESVLTELSCQIVNFDDQIDFFDLEGH